MALTLADIKPLSQDKLTKFVIDEFRKSPVLGLLPFDNTVKPQGGTTLAYVYNRVTTQPTAAARAINSEYTAQETKTTAYTVALKIFGGSFEIDRVLAEDENGQVVDNVTFQLQQKIKATEALFNDFFINGDSSQNALAFDGLDKAIKNTSTDMTLNIDLSDAEKVKANWSKFTDGLRRFEAKFSERPTAYFVSRDAYAVIQSVADFANGFTSTKDEWGREVLKYGNAQIIEMGDKPGSTTPIIATDANGKTAIYAAYLGMDGVHGVAPTGAKVVKTFLPDMSAPGAVKKGEVEMVAAVAVKATRAAGVLRGIKITTPKASS